MNYLLYNERYQKRETWNYEINSGGELMVKEKGSISIVFVDGKFEGVSFPLSGKYSRNGWRILSQIERKITEIENSIKGEQ